jgi:hypothetical protein
MSYISFYTFGLSYFYCPSPENPIVPLAQKINGKILGLLHAVDTTMLIAQIGYKLSNDAANLCDPFAPLNGNTHPPGLSTPEALQTMAAHGHGHCQRTNESLRGVQQQIFKVYTCFSPGLFTL